MRARGYKTVQWLRKRDENKRGGLAPVPISGGREHRDSLVNLVDAHLEWLEMRNYSKTTLHQRRSILFEFCRWALERELERASIITRPIMESYQRWVFRYRQKNGKPLSVQSQRHRLIVVQTFFRWACRANHILHNPASELEMPRRELRLPGDILTLEQVGRVLARPDVSDPLGIRDRAILEVFYSTGIRRSELAHLEVGDLNEERRTLQVRQGKGKKDRVTPIGIRALGWVLRYLAEVRPRLTNDLHERAMFVTGYGKGFSVEALGRAVVNYLRKAGVKDGGCHAFRHTCATQMLENGADIRYIQQMLGHANLNSTQVYTQVSIKALQEVHARTHPAEKEDALQTPQNEGIVK